MKFVADESVDKPVVNGLRKSGFDVYSIQESLAGAADEDVLELANKQRAILITADKDFGYLVFHKQLCHFGVVLLRIPGLSFDEKIRVVKEVIQKNESRIEKSFVVISPRGARIKLHLPTHTS